MKRNHEVTIRFSLEELQLIKKKALDLGQTISSFIRLVSIKSKVNVEDYSE
jgi:predicted DNA binding CopG/RHH family protein